ncbi:uncharacterized protein BO97DRAFT_447210 [Aspergillus homomorphus CBS 101889]|uniref:Zn(2)-C6 fungal-type domain-containing protein n=1 Tax=Aspergillus homomorphus (strain CBS 101889) TaxID=1450537 RepID=A0A395HHH8_ASPHC|nr:hypothetical protein BO97DRAFT_447210 [Aspergillus homomorphus CBS 101889]RAL06949.1 hypothetical protein BO97DRAFT_447210 [Aspergillus homomorphus CBS 101889]
MHRYDSSSGRMKLSCSRCKDRKLKCDRGEPQCKRCLTSGKMCSYPERRKVRTTRPSADLHRLGHRLEVLEERLNKADPPHLSTSLPSPTPTQPRARPETEPITSESEHRSDTWIYRMVSGAKDNIGSLTTNTPLPLSQSTADHAITRLDTALVNLAAPTRRPDNNSTDAPRSHLPLTKATQCVETFLDCVLPHLTIFDSFATVVDAEFLRTMPLIIDSPYVKVEPVMLVVYLNALYFGQTAGTAEEQRSAVQTYYQCLHNVPKWLASAQGSYLDLLAASLTAWMAINNFDYHLAWQFHREACRFGNLLGVHEVDLPTAPAEEEAEKEKKRRTHWYLVEVDFLFRIWYEKPPVLRVPMAQVRLPAEISPQTKQPKPNDCIIFLVWSRALFIMADFFDHPIPTSTADTCCNELEELVDDWALLSHARSPNIDHIKSWLYVDTIIALHIFIIFMRRKASSAEEIVHPQAVRSARLIIILILEWSNISCSASGNQSELHTLCLTFYPFSAFFTLYYHILSSTDPSEYENDLRTLEKVVNTMSAAAAIRPDLIPIADAVSALNDVSRAFHSGRHPDFTMICSTEALQPGSQELGALNNQNEFDPSAAEMPPFESLLNLTSVLSPQTADEIGGMFGVPFQLQSHITEAGGTRSAATRTVSQPLDFVRAVENELTWRNWHESWWNPPGGAALSR